MNPLNTDQTFYLTLANPNPTSSKTKEGPIYRISVEVSREEWDWFMETETKGMVIECACQVSHKNEKRDPDTVDVFTGKADREEVKGGPLSQRSDYLARDPEFHVYVSQHDPETNDAPMTDEDARQFIREYCNVDSRKYIDHDPEASRRFKDLLSDFTRWGNNEN